MPGRTILGSFFVAAFLGAVANAWGHARQVTPAPRNNNAGLKTPPCGNVPPGADTTKYAVMELDQTYSVTVEETIQHPGKFIYNLLDRNGNKIADLLTVTDDINLGRKTMSLKMDSAKGARVCNDCILQMIQRMEENPDNPTFYYSCADVKIVAAGSNAPTTLPTADGRAAAGELANQQCEAH